MQGATGATSSPPARHTHPQPTATRAILSPLLLLQTMLNGGTKYIKSHSQTSQARSFLWTLLLPAAATVTTDVWIYTFTLSSNYNLILGAQSIHLTHTRNIHTTRILWLTKRLCIAFFPCCSYHKCLGSFS